MVSCILPAHGLLGLLKRPFDLPQATNIGALIIRIGFGGPLILYL